MKFFGLSGEEEKILRQALGERAKLAREERRNVRPPAEANRRVVAALWWALGVKWQDKPWLVILGVIGIVGLALYFTGVWPPRSQAEPPPAAQGPYPYPPQSREEQARLDRLNELDRQWRAEREASRKRDMEAIAKMKRRAPCWTDITISGWEKRQQELIEKHGCVQDDQGQWEIPEGKPLPE